MSSDKIPDDDKLYQEFDLNIDLELIHKKISNAHYWSDNVWMESMLNNFINSIPDHDYCLPGVTEDRPLVAEEFSKTNDDSASARESRKVGDKIAPLVEESSKINAELPSTPKEAIVAIDKSSESQKFDSIEYYDDNAEFPNAESLLKTAKTNHDSGIDSSISSFLTESEDSFTSNASFEDHSYHKFNRNENVPVKTYANKRKLIVDTTKGSEVDAKKVHHNAPKRSREVFISEESPVIEGEFDLERRVTRLLVKSCEDRPARLYVENLPGKLVWGCFRTGWWPALIIKAEDAGMISTAGKIWVSWIGEARISELREKLVEPFSSNLEARLDSLIAHSKTKSTCKKMKDDACYQTILLLKKQFHGGALIKPYATWIKNNILPHKDKLDDLLFYPYPDSLSDTLSDLKKVNAAKTEKYLRDKEQEKINKANEQKAQNSARKVEKPEKPIEEGGINIMDQKPGMIVWAKISGYSLWPCVMMNYQHLNKKQPNLAHQWVMWYGDYKYSQVEYRQIFNFPTGMEKMEAKVCAMKDELFSKAVLHASKDYCDQLGYPIESWTLETVTHLFYKSSDRHKLKEAQLIQPNDEDLYSKMIKKQLRKQINNQPVSEERRKLILKNQNLQRVLSGKAEPESLCISCFASDNLQDHPFFHASMCDQCLEEFRPKVFAYGDDGKCFFCTLCGGDDLVAMCDSMNCPRVFCTACIKYILSPSRYEEILLQHPWYCFLCCASTLADSVMKMRENWQNRMITLYRVNCDDRSRTNLERFEKGRKIRVLSLFDGIGTGLLVLKKLNIELECYYASEIDLDSMQVSFFNHGDEIIQLGDVRDIDEKKIREIAPIDLLIGGSPCNELSLANPKRRGLDDPEGSGVLFYDYCRIKKLVKKYNKKRHLFWLFENVASMPKKFRQQISENLGRDPQFLDSADFSAQHRPRLYWGNLPWGPYQAKDVILQDMLRKRCNRQALVKKIMTVTTRSNSLNQTKENIKPVLMNGKKDMLWITELEEIFGFPMHYTDANLQKTRRLQLIGKAWSVQTLTAILRPLFYF